MIKAKIVSSLEKAFLDSSIDSFTTLEATSALLGERLSFQLIYTNEREGNPSSRIEVLPRIRGVLSEYAKIHKIEHMPVRIAADPIRFDEDYLRYTPGLYPDLVASLAPSDSVFIVDGSLDSLWIEINIPKDGLNLSGISELCIELVEKNSGKILKVCSLNVEVIGAALPEQELKFTQWFYCDCLAQYYGVEVWSERHFEIIEKFVSFAVMNGINMLLTPVLTPPLDTAVGGERLTTQLVLIKKNKKGYRFNFKLLDKWIDMCNRAGVKYLEISHLFTQWGATHAPKVMAEVDGEYRQIFGWDTDAHGEEYKQFLRSFLRALIRHLKKRGDDVRCFFHVSDEPHGDQILDYKKSKAIVSRILRGYPIMDALSNFEFYKGGIVEVPIPATSHIEPFLKANIKGLWTYYCCSQSVDVSNRFVAMPSWRNRAIGMQMYKYGIEGFLHWGYNFYNSRFSINPVNPYLDLCGNLWVPAGDTFSVYPGEGGEPLASIRLLVFYEAICDIRAMKLCEELYSKEEVVREIEATLGEAVRFDRCPTSAEALLSVRAKINEMIKRKL